MMSKRWLTTREYSTPLEITPLAAKRLPVPERERGQALVEVAVVAGFVLVPLLLMGVYVGKWAYTQDRSIEAARYAAWERIVWRNQPPAGRQWTALRTDGVLRDDVAVRFFGGRGEKLESDNRSAAQGAGTEPLLHKHDGQPLLTEREKHIALQTREEVNAMDKGLLKAALVAAKQGQNGMGIDLTGPTVATVSVTLDGIPQRLFREVGLQQPLTFTGQAAVLTDPWSAKGPSEAQAISERLATPPQIEGIRHTQRGIKVIMDTLRATGFLLGGLFGETASFHSSPTIPVNPELQFGDRLQPAPQIPSYRGP